MKIDTSENILTDKPKSIWTLVSDNKKVDDKLPLKTQKVEKSN